MDLKVLPRSKADRWVFVKVWGGPQTLKFPTDMESYLLQKYAKCFKHHYGLFRCDLDFIWMDMI